MQGASVQAGKGLPTAAPGGTAAGLIPMAVFTTFYGLWPMFAWPIPGAIFFAIALTLSASFAFTARRVSRSSRDRPAEATDARIAQGVTRLAYAQSGLILLAIVVLNLTGQSAWIVPVVAMIMALHFFPLAPMLGRVIEYYLGTAMAITALTGLALAGLGYTQQVVWAATGIGGALVTGTYGCYLSRKARRHLAGDESNTGAG